MLIVGGSISQEECSAGDLTLFDFKINDKLSFGVEFNPELCEGYREVFVYLKENATGLAVQDLALVRTSCDIRNNVIHDNEFEVLVWGDECSEDYTDRYVIPLDIERCDSIDK